MNDPRRERAGRALRQQVGAGGDAAADEDRGEPGAVQGGQAERGGEVQDEKEAEQPVRPAADLEQLILGRGDGGHIRVIDRDGNDP